MQGEIENILTCSLLNLTQAGLYIEPSGDGNSEDRLVTQSLGTAAPHCKVFPNVVPTLTSVAAPGLVHLEF